MAEEQTTAVEQVGDEGDQEVVTLDEVLESQQELMEDANAVLGALDDKKCTYAEGYMKRQALYSCLTCVPESKTNVTKAAGICLACCYNCHEGHELVELYTKRNFRCDCGNEKFPNQQCNLNNSKDDVNELNEYNQNFSGLYCTCNRPYPDAEDSIADDMIQCIICEDWYHSRHLGVEVPSVTYAEMTCESCVKKHEFLLHYEALCVSNALDIEGNVENVTEVKEQTVEPEQEVTSTTDNVQVQVDGNEAAALTNGATSSVHNDLSNSNDLESKEIKDLNNSIDVDMEAKELTDVSIVETDLLGTDSVVALNGDDEKCKMQKTQIGKISTKFWGDHDWRKQLCTCPDCRKVYENEKVLFLIDPKDPVFVYEEEGKAKAREFEEKQHEDDMKFLNSLNRVPLLNAIQGYNDMKTNLTEYLKKFAENKKVVREEDIREFFSNYDTKNKKQKLDVQHFCR